MGKDTKYLTLALVALLGIATLIVLFPRKNKEKVSDIHTETEIEQNADDANTAIKTNNGSTSLYADNPSDAQTVSDAYNTLSGGKTNTSTTDENTSIATKTVVKEEKPKTNIPDDYEALTKVKRTAEKSVAKPKATKPEEKLNADKLSGFLVVTNQFSSKANAQGEIDKLKAKGYANANSISLDNKVHMAYAGKLATREEAQKLLNQLKAKGFKPMIKDLN
jgi:cell division septation protein DedD